MIMTVIVPLPLTARALLWDAADPRTTGRGGVRRHVTTALVACHHNLSKVVPDFCCVLWLPVADSAGLSMGI